MFLTVRRGESDLRRRAGQTHAIRKPLDLQLDGRGGIDVGIVDFQERFGNDVLVDPVELFGRADQIQLRRESAAVDSDDVVVIDPWGGGDPDRDAERFGDILLRNGQNGFHL